MSKTSNDPDFRLVFRPLAGTVPPIIRLRRLLKTALRAFGLRCIAFNEVPRDGPKPTLASLDKF